MKANTPRADAVHAASKASGKPLNISELADANRADLIEAGGSEESGDAIWAQTMDTFCEAMLNRPGRVTSAQTKTETQKGMSLEGRVSWLERRLQEKSHDDSAMLLAHLSLNVLQLPTGSTNIKPLREVAAKILTEYLQGK